MKKATRKKATKAAAPPPSPIDGVDVGKFLADVGTVAGMQPRGGDVVALIYARGVTDQESADLMGEASNAAKGLARQVEAEFAGVVGLAHKLHRALTTMCNKFAQPLADAARAADKKIADWARAEQLRRFEEAEAERRRIDKLEKQRIAAAAVQIARDNPDVDAREAAALARDTAEAPPVYAPEPVQVAGKSISMPYVAEVLSEIGVVKAVAGGKLPLSCLTIKQTELNRYAQAHGPTGAIPGTLRIARGATIRKKA